MIRCTNCGHPLTREAPMNPDAVERLVSAIAALSFEWDAYIGIDDQDGHDDAVLVGEKVSEVRDTLGDFLADQATAQT